MSLKEADDMTPRSLINPKSISAAIEYFFGRGELSQVVDQTNPLAQLTHERRLSALGPGGLNRKRAGFEVRDVHISHYGRICPIETPEGTNIGLISSLGIYGGVDEYGFLITPYRKIKHGKKSEEVVWMRADEESEAYLAPADAVMDDHGKLKGPSLTARYQTDFVTVAVDQIEYMDISPKQMVGVSAGLIPFLEHDDANRRSWVRTCSARRCRSWWPSRRSSPPGWSGPWPAIPAWSSRRCRMERSPMSIPPG